MKTKPKVNLPEWQETHFKLSNGVLLKICHNLPNQIQAAFDNWIARTKKYTEESFCEYINDKRKQGLTDHIAYTKAEYDKVMLFRKDNIVYFVRTEEFWDKSFPMKQHHTPDTKSVILRGKIIDEKNNEFKAMLIDNNGFEKDGQSFVFNKGTVLSNQDFKDFEELGKWKINT